MKIIIPCALFNFIHKPENLQTQQLVVKQYSVYSNDRIIEILSLEQQSQNKSATVKPCTKPTNFFLVMGFK